MKLKPEMNLQALPIMPITQLPHLIIDIYKCDITLVDLKTLLRDTRRVRVDKPSTIRVIAEPLFDNDNCMYQQITSEKFLHVMMFVWSHVPAGSYSAWITSFPMFYSPSLDQFHRYLQLGRINAVFEQKSHGALEDLQNEDMHRVLINE